MRNRTYGGVRGRKTKVGRKLLRFPPTRFIVSQVEGVLNNTPDGLKPVFGFNRMTLFLHKHLARSAVA